MPFTLARVGLETTHTIAVVLFECFIRFHTPRYWQLLLTSASIPCGTRLVGLGAMTPLHRAAASLWRNNIVLSSLLIITWSAPVEASNRRDRRMTCTGEVLPCNLFNGVADCGKQLGEHCCTVLEACRT